MLTLSRNESLKYLVLSIFAAMLLLLLVLVAPLQAGSVYYAAPSSVGSGDCGSWSSACTLSTALLQASGSPGSEIWVLEGVHKPTTVITDRMATFFVPDGVAIYGGFAGWESAREERDWENNVTILSGDIDGNDATNPAGVVTSTANITGTNSYHVLLGGAAPYTAVLDGFTVTGGYADGTYSGWCDQACGGGMYNNNGQVSIDNVTFSGNYAIHTGGGMYNIYGSPIMSGTSFINNQSDQGGGLALRRSASVMTNTSFFGNEASKGGGIYVVESVGSTWSGYHTLMNVYVSGNRATSLGGGMYNSFGTVTLENSYFANNEAGQTGGGFYTYGNATFTTTLTNVVFVENTAVSESGGGMRDDFGQAFYTDVTFEGNLAGGCGGGLYTSNASSTLSGGSFIGNESTCGGGMAMHDGATSLNGTLFSGNSTSSSGTYNGGGMHVEYGQASFSDVTFDNNTAANHGGGLYTFNNASTTLTATTFINNSAGFYGGGMDNLVSSSSMTYTLFISNTAVGGGGMSNRGGGSHYLTGITFSGNQAEIGGGIYNENSAALENVTFTKNEATDGGGMYLEYGQLSFSDVAFDGNTATRHGGGLYTAGTTATLTNTLFISNTAISGGGVFNTFGGSQSLSVVTFESNKASGAGGGMYNEISALLDNVSFTNNEGYDGGGLYNYGNPGIATLLDVTFSGNNATYGGGMFDAYGPATLSDVLFQGNTAIAFGGGLYENHASAVLTNVLFIENFSQSGGGLAAYDSSPTLTNVLFRGNSASILAPPQEDSGRGGAFYNFGSGPTLTNATFSGNQAEVGGGAMYNRSTSNPVINNSILWGDTLEEFSSDATGTLTINSSDVAGGCPAGGACSHLLDSDPFFVDPVGGDLRLLPGSPSIDAGDNSLITASTDLSGGPRFIDIPGYPDTGLGTPPLVDMGAYEANFVDAALLKTVSSATYEPGTAITFTLSFSNSGSITATLATVSDEVPWYLTSPVWSWSGAGVNDTGQQPPFIWSVQDLEPGLSGVINLTGVLTTPLAAGIYSNTAVISVNDDAATGNNTATLSFEVPNVAPFFSSTPKTAATQDSPYSYDISAEDLNGDSLPITAPTKPDWLILSDNGDGTALISGTPGNGDLGNHAVLLSVTDGDLTAEQPFTITVADINDAPFFSSTPVTSATQDVFYSYSVTAGDPDLIWGDVLTITALTKPDWLVGVDHGDGTGAFFGTPDNSEVGDHDVLLRVIDSGGLTDDQPFTITVANVNDKPVFTSAPVTSATQDVLYSTNVTADDPDLIWGDVLTITAPTKPGWLTLSDNGDGTATLSGTPDNSEVGDHDVLLRVTDSGGLDADQPFTLTVANINDTPYFSSTPVTVATQDALYSYSITADDPDLIWGDALTITAPTKPGWLMLTDNGDGTATLFGTPHNGDVGDHPVLLSVTDSSGLIAEQLFTITVANVNDAPVFTSTPVTDIAQNIAYSYAIRADDLDLIWGDVLTISAPTKPDWLTLSDHGDGTATLTGISRDAEIGTYAVMLRVTDSDGLSDTQSFTITVRGRFYLPLLGN